MCKKIIKVPVFNYSGSAVTMKSKRAYSNWIFNITCPNCSEIVEYEPNTYTLLYVPETFPHVNFYCEDCEHEAKVFNLEDIVDGKAHLSRHPDFKGAISISKLVQLEIDTI